VDYVVLPRWKNMLIHLLNIAGIGPVIGVISGIKFGPIVFIIIPVGCLLMGAVNDFVAGMMSLRHNGANLTELVRIYFTKKGYYFFSVFVSITLLLVVAVFINVPANLIKAISGGNASVFYISVVAIFVYYIIATLFPVDKIIGKAYPVFGLVLLVGTGFIFVSLMIRGFQNPDILQASEGFKAQMFTMANNHPILPLLFVNIACGILSGFHGTQAPIVARTMKNESEAKNTFFGMMAAEGFIAMVWAAGALVIYNKFPALMNDNPNSVLIRIAQEFVSGKYIGTIVVVSVIILAITSGDTALRSLRLSVAE